MLVFDRGVCRYGGRTRGFLRYRGIVCHMRSCLGARTGDEPCPDFVEFQGYRIRTSEDGAEAALRIRPWATYEYSNPGRTVSCFRTGASDASQGNSVHQGSPLALKGWTRAEGHEVLESPLSG